MSEKGRQVPHDAPVHPPIATGVDHTHAHAPHTGRRWVDMVIALSAITISVISLFVAIGHGRIEERLVAANSWPFLIYDSDVAQRDAAGQLISLRLKNSGVGPARVQSVVMALDGKVIRSHDELMRQCCGVTPGSENQTLAAGLENENALVGVISARDSVTFLAWRAKPGNEAVMRKLDAARRRLTFSACYCSVLEECWRTDLKSTTTPRPVKSCPIGGDSYID